MRLTPQGQPYRVPDSLQQSAESARPKRAGPKPRRVNAEGIKVKLDGTPSQRPGPKRRRKCPCGSGVVLAGGNHDCYVCQNIRKHKVSRNEARVPEGAMDGSGRRVESHTERIERYRERADQRLPLFCDGPPAPEEDEEQDICEEDAA